MSGFPEPYSTPGNCLWDPPEEEPPVDEEGGIERDETPDEVVAYRKCGYCKQFFPLLDHPEKDSRQVCDRECAVNLGRGL